MRRRAPWWRLAAGSRSIAYAVAVAVPIALTYLVSRLQLPPFVFEHLVVLLVLGVAIPWGLGPAVVTALVSVLSDNILLREPVGRPTISGSRDVIDLLLFATVAIVVSGLMRRAHDARRVAQDAAARERQAREERDWLIATVSHDLATPLAVLSGTVTLARQRGSLSDQDASRLLGRLDTACARATSLLRTLSDAQALEQDDLGLQLAPHDLRDIVRPTLTMLDRFSDRHPIVATLPDRAVPVRADADRLQRVVENLVNNAIKYSPGGGLVEVSIEIEDARAVLRVRDHGIGIAPDAMPHIFERSYRDPDAARHAPGLGLGLAIAAQVIERHGGSIAAAPAAGGGTLMHVRLPLADSLEGAGLAERAQVAGT